LTGSTVFAANRERFLAAALDRYRLIHVASHADDRCGDSAGVGADPEHRDARESKSTAASSAQISWVCAFTPTRSC